MPFGQDFESNFGSFWTQNAPSWEHYGDSALN